MTCRYLVQPSLDLMEQIDQVARGTDHYSSVLKYKRVVEAAIERGHTAQDRVVLRRSIGSDPASLRCSDPNFLTTEIEPVKIHPTSVRRLWMSSMSLQDPIARLGERDALNPLSHSRSCHPTVHHHPERLSTTRQDLSSVKRGFLGVKYYSPPKEFLATLMHSYSYEELSLTGKLSWAGTEDLFSDCVTGAEGPTCATSPMPGWSTENTSFPPEKAICDSL